MKVFLDNLNLLYVAFTRAEVGLLVSAPSIDTRGAKGTIAGLLFEALQSEESLRSRWDEEKLEWKSGSLQHTATGKKDDRDALQLQEYLSSAWREKLVIRQSGSSWFQHNHGRQKANHGIYMHAVLSRIEYASEAEEILTQLVHEGLITSAERPALQRQVQALLMDPKIADWFSASWKVRTEVPILLPGGEENRIDRLLIKDQKAVVVDYKTGTRKKSDEKQVLQYMEILRQMNFLDIEGYLLYLYENEIVKVTAGAKPKLLHRPKEKSQLDLNF
jgi:ATP-dependent helicase/nuclease subunit A